MNLCAFVIFNFYINMFIIFISKMCLFLFKNDNTDVLDCTDARIGQ